MLYYFKVFLKHEKSSSCSAFNAFLLNDLGLKHEICRFKIRKQKYGRFEYPFSQHFVTRSLAKVAVSKCFLYILSFGFFFHLIKIFYLRNVLRTSCIHYMFEISLQIPSFTFFPVNASLLISWCISDV